MKIDMEREAEICESWLTVQNYQFKILVMIAVLAENKLAFRGKLKDMCEFLGVSNQKANTDKIKEAIKKLVEKGDILVVQEGHTWTLTLTNKAQNKPKVKKIKNAWIAAIQNYKVDKDNHVSWENILKVLVFLCADKKEIKRYDEIGKALGLSESTCQNAVKALVNIDFNDIYVKRKLAWLKLDEGKYRVVGQRFEVGYDFSL